MGRDGRQAPQKFGRLGKGLNRDDRHPRHHGCLPGVVVGYDDSRIPGVAGRQGGGKGADDRFYAPVQGQLAQHQVAAQGPLIDHLGCRKQAQGDGQVEAGALFLDGRRGEVDGDAVIREAVARVLDGRLDPLLALPDGGFRQADDVEDRQAGGDIHLHLHRVGLDPDHGAAQHFCQQGGSSIAGVKNDTTELSL